MTVGDLRVLDQFTDGDYAENDGPSDWSNSWQGGGSPNSGVIRVSGGRLRIGGDEVDLDGRSISRQVDFSSATEATLSFSYQRQRLDDSGGRIRLQVSADGGGSWTTLKTYHLTGTDAAPD